MQRTGDRKPKNLGDTTVLAGALLRDDIADRACSAVVEVTKDR